MAPPDDGRHLGGHTPSGASVLIQCYEAIAATSRRMLIAAHADDWDEVVRLEGQCREQIAQLKRAARSRPLGAAEQRRRIELLRAILANDAQVRQRSEPWLRQLERLIEPGRGARRA
jgi:flagellar protein FliT